MVILESIKRIIDTEVRSDADVKGYYVITRTGSIISENNVSTFLKNKIFAICLTVPDDTIYVLLELKDERIIILKQGIIFISIIYPKDIKLGYVMTRIARLLEYLGEHPITVEERIEEKSNKSSIVLEEIKTKEENYVTDKTIDINKHTSLIPVPTDKFSEIITAIKNAEDIEPFSDKALYVAALIDGEISIEEIIKRLDYVERELIIAIVNWAYKNDFIKLKKSA